MTRQGESGYGSDPRNHVGSSPSDAYICELVYIKDFRALFAVIPVLIARFNEWVIEVIEENIPAFVKTG